MASLWPLIEESTTTMPSLIEHLPGQFLRIAEVNETLAQMWKVDTPDGDAPSEFRASQMNLILHFGIKVSPEEAREKFDTAIQFAQRYPCRILIICPEPPENTSDNPLEAKLYTQCFLGKDLREMCCVEVLMLAYDIKQNDFMENQVSVWLENDLPVYYWFIRMPAHRVRDRFMPFLKQCRRVVFDSSIEEDDYTALDWPEHTRARDLAQARALPLRQGLGQFLSAFSPEDITDQLQTIDIGYCEPLSGEASCIAHWFERCIDECLAQTGRKAKIETRLHLADCKETALKLTCQYANDKHFSWELCHEQRNAHLKCNLNHGSQEQSMRVQLLASDKALSEAVFFGSA